MSDTRRRIRGQDWFDNPDHIDVAALYPEQFINHRIAQPRRWRKRSFGT